MIKLTIKGQVRPKKNNKQRTGKFLVVSKQYKKRHKEAIRQINHDFIEKTTPYFIELHFFNEDLRKRDLTNMAESIMDVLVEAWYIEDDNCMVCSNITLIYWWKDKENPRVDIVIW